jgi:hypothetical protein
MLLYSKDTNSAMENGDENKIIQKFPHNNQRIFDETYSNKYNNRINIFLKLLLVNLFICLILIVSYYIKIHRNIDIIIFYTFSSMMVFHLIGMVHGIMYWNDLKKQKNGEAIYLKEYYPDIWGKINPYGHLVWRYDLLKYQSGKYIPKNTDPIIDKIRKDKRKFYIYFLPFTLVILFIIIGLIIS